MDLDSYTISFICYTLINIAFIDIIMLFARFHLFLLSNILYVKYFV